MGLDRPDDAGVYKISEDLALIQTVDFFTPIVDDPYDFGQIAVANALSDVYAMGGRPLCAMNITCFPIKDLNISILREILKGGLDKMREGKVALVGGHSVQDKELKYGLAVTGLVHPDRVLTSTGAKAGDKLILTKCLGTGIINTAVKGELASPEAVSKVIASMAALNARAAELMASAPVTACTDVTGFGLICHAYEMLDGSRLGLMLDSEAVPFFPEAREYSAMGLLPGGLQRNREFRQDKVQTDAELPEYMLDILYDPQTSGGLLIALPDEAADTLLKRLRVEGMEKAAIIGEFTDTAQGFITIR